MSEGFDYPEVVVASMQEYDDLVIEVTFENMAAIIISKEPKDEDYFGCFLEPAERGITKKGRVPVSEILHFLDAGVAALKALPHRNEV